jgi:hypothetical protein
VEGLREGSGQQVLTGSPCLVEIDDLVDKLDFGEALANRLPNQIRIAALVRAEEVDVEHGVRRRRDGGCRAVERAAAAADLGQLGWMWPWTRDVLRCGSSCWPADSIFFSLGPTEYVCFIIRTVNSVSQYNNLDWGSRYV